jgi:hypothetical protein
MAIDVASPIIGGDEVLDKLGRWYAVSGSARTISWLQASQSPSWSTLSYVGTDQMSGNSRSYWDLAYIYESGISEHMLVMTNNVDQPKYFKIDPDTETYSDYTFLNSFMSTAKSVVAFDDRLVFFNVQKDGLRRPARVVWTPRGLPTSDLILQGAGAQDLLEMRGIGQKIIRDQEGVLLFSDREIWRGRPRRDIFSFDFFALTQKHACPFPRTIVNTTAGVIFLGQDYELYLISGSVITPIGQPERREPSKIKSLLIDELVEPDRAWGTFNRRQNRYELYYKTTSGSFPTKAVYVDLETSSYLVQQFTHELSHGFQFADPDPFPPETWDQQGDTFINVIEAWDETGVPQRAALEDSDTMTFGSASTAYRLRSGQTTDDGTAVDCRWRSHGMGRNRKEYENLHEVWTEYESTSASSASVFCSHDLGQTFDSGFAISLRSSSHSVEFTPLDCEARSPQFEFRLNDGGTPRITSFEATLLPSGSKFGGGP